jgi:hypothetical protein
MSQRRKWVVHRLPTPNGSNGLTGPGRTFAMSLRSPNPNRKAHINQMQNLRSSVRLILAASLCVTAQLVIAKAAHAQAASTPAATNAPAAVPAPTPPPPPKWSSVASASMAVTEGNTRSFLATGGIESTRKTELDELLLAASAGYGKTTTLTPGGGPSTTSKSQDFLKGSGQDNYSFVDDLYAGFRVEGVHDDIAGIDYRLTVSPLIGYYIYKHPNSRLSVEAGPSYVNQRLEDHTSSYAAARAAERYEYSYKGGAKIWQTLEYLTQVNEGRNWIATFEVGASAPLTKSVDVRLVADDQYQHEAPLGYQRNDFKLLAGIGYKF